MSYTISKAEKGGFYIMDRSPDLFGQISMPIGCFTTLREALCFLEGLFDSEKHKEAA